MVCVAEGDFDDVEDLHHELRQAEGLSKRVGFGGVAAGEVGVDGVESDGGGLSSAQDHAGGLLNYGQGALVKVILARVELLDLPLHGVGQVLAGDGASDGGLDVIGQKNNEGISWLQAAKGRGGIGKLKPACQCGLPRS